MVHSFLCIWVIQNQGKTSKTSNENLTTYRRGSVVRTQSTYVYPLKNASRPFRLFTSRRSDRLFIGSGFSRDLENARFPRGGGPYRRGIAGFDAVTPFTVLMFTIYHRTSNCLPDDKESSSSSSSFLTSVPFYFAETRACLRITYGCRMRLYRADTCPTYRLVTIVPEPSYLVVLSIFSMLRVASPHGRQATSRQN